MFVVLQCLHVLAELVFVCSPSMPCAGLCFTCVQMFNSMHDFVFVIDADDAYSWVQVPVLPAVGC
ncbi:hypothetical protein M758_UG167800 [Ceratodon purpureus]|nr:hypothetical protein M758_UG167800 [Ceratodon purpureus]